MFLVTIVVAEDGTSANGGGLSDFCVADIGQVIGFGVGMQDGFVGFDEVADLGLCADHGAGTDMGKRADVGAGFEA